MATPVNVSSANQPEMQTGGYTNEKGFAGNPHTQDAYQGQAVPVRPDEYVHEKGFAGPPQAQGTYQEQAAPVGPNEYIDKDGVKRKKRGGLLAACLAVCWCCTWPCHGPCCGGL